MNIPFAVQTNFKMKTRGKYAMGWPRGAIVHFTAGRDGAENTLKYGASQGHTYLCIQKDGQIFQAHPANEWGYHAGESAWTRFAKKLVGSVSDDLIGIEICNAGKVTPIGNGKFKTWFGVELDSSQVRYTEGKANQQKGWYEKYTPKQEDALKKVLFWLKDQNKDVFDFDFVLGHDEVAGVRGLGWFRKNDPGAALSMTMDEFRSNLKSMYSMHKIGQY